MFEPRPSVGEAGSEWPTTPRAAWRSRPQGLTDAELARAEQLARRLLAALREVMGLLPEGERSASAMSRALTLDRATCQRIVAAGAKPEPGAGALVQLPGVQGLGQFIDAVSRRRTDSAAAEALASARAAVDQFDELLCELAGSQRRLKERLMETGRGMDGGGRSTPLGSDDPRVRESLFELAAEVTGRCSAAAVYMRIIRPTPGDPRRTEHVMVRGLIGHQARARAVPLVIGSEAALQVDDPNGPAGQKPTYTPLDAGSAAAGAGSLLRPFCSSPLPRVVARTAGARVVQVVDAPQGLEDGADIVIANRHAKGDAHPAALDPPVGEVWALMTFPSRALVFDTYLHRDIARRCIPSLELHLWEPDVGKQGATRWATQFPTGPTGGPRLEVLGPGLNRSATGSYPRHAELTAYLFEQLGWPADEFVGYRCETAYPVWRAGYCMVFDFAGNELR